MIRRPLCCWSFIQTSSTRFSFKSHFLFRDPCAAERNADMCCLRMWPSLYRENETRSPNTFPGAGLFRNPIPCRKSLFQDAASHGDLCFTATHYCCSCARLASAARCSNNQKIVLSFFPRGVALRHQILGRISASLAMACAGRILEF